MKIILTMVVLAHLSCSTSNKENQIKGDCILVEVTKIKASCGIFSVWVGMKFKKKNSGYTFVGLVHCPEMYEGQGYGEEFFIAGKIYKLVAIKPYKLDPGELVLNEYSETGLPVYKIEELKRKDKPTIDTRENKIQIPPLQ
jgi:hypothetical protein